MSRTARYRAIAVLLATSLLAASALLWYDRPDGGADIGTTGTDSTADVDRIVIRRPGRPPLRLARGEPSLGAAGATGARTPHGDDEPGGWEIVAPHRLPANPRRLAPLLALPTTGGEDYRVDQIDPRAAGLATPVAIIDVGDRRLEIGGPDHTGDRRYLRDGDRVRLIDAWVLDLVQGGVGAFAELAPFATGLETLALDDGGSSTVDLPADVWASLSATQIADWPREDANVYRRLALVARTADGLQRFTLALGETYAALVPAGAGFAYVIAHDDLPPLLTD